MKSAAFDWDGYDVALGVGRVLRRRQRKNGGILTISHDRHQFGRGHISEQIDPAGVVEFILRGPNPFTPTSTCPQDKSQPSRTSGPRVAEGTIAAMPIIQAPIAKRGPRAGETVSQWHQRLRDAAAAAV